MQQSVPRWFSPLTLFTRAFGQVFIISYVPLTLARAGNHHYLDLGLIYALPFLMQLLFAPLWGHLLDRHRRLGLVAAIGFLGYALMELGTAFAPGVGAILLALAVGGVFVAALSPAAKWHALGDADGAAKLSGALQGEAAGWLAGAVVPAAASYLGIGLFQLLAVVGVGTLVLAPLSLRAAKGELGPGRSVRPAPAPLDPAALRAAGLAVLGILLQFLSGETFFSFYGVYLTTFLRGPLWLYSLTLAGTTAIGLWLYAPALRLVRRIGTERVLFGTSLWYLVSYLALFLRPSVALAAVVFTVPAFSFLRVASSLAFAQAAPQRGGAAMGAFDSAEGIGCSLGGPLSGLVVGSFGLGALPLVPLTLSALAPWPLWVAQAAARRRAEVRPPAQSAGIS